MINKEKETTAVIILYIISSVMTITINKYLLSILLLKSQFLFLAMQSFIVTLLAYIFYLLRIVDLKRKSVLYWMPHSLFLTLMIYSSSKTLEYLDISIFTLLKNFSIIITAVLEYYIYEKVIDLNSWLSFILMFISSYVGEKDGFVFNIIGYLYMSINIISTSVYVLLIKESLNKGASRSDPVLYCNLLSIPLLIIGSMFEPFDTKLINNINIIILIIISGVTVFFTGFTTSWCLTLISSTGLSMLGALNKLFISFAGIIFIGEKNVGPLKITSLFVGSVAGLLYSVRIKKPNHSKK